MDSFSNETGKGCVISLIIIVSMIIGTYYYRKSNNIIEPNVKIQKYNDSLRIKVDNLDSIKNAKVIEVKTLDNDSIIKLFYKHIK